MVGATTFKDNILRERLLDPDPSTVRLLVTLGYPNMEYKLSGLW